MTFNKIEILDQKKEFEHWKKACPISNFRKYLKKKFKNLKIEKLENNIIKKTENSYKKAVKSK